MLADKPHSPGPWRVTCDAGDWHAACDQNGTSCYQGIRDADGVVVGIAVAHDASVHWSTKVDPDTNARLMAAAPDLLDALRTFLAWELGTVDTGLLRSEVIDKAKSAISKT
jgi:hypothetical protein